MLKTKKGEIVSLNKKEAKPYPGEGLLRLPDVIHVTGLSRAHIYALAADGQFPKPVKISDRASGWVASEIDTFVAARIAATREA
jgi:prophage regulatory protein